MKKILSLLLALSFVFCGINGLALDYDWSLEDIPDMNNLWFSHCVYDGKKYKTPISDEDKNKIKDIISSYEVTIGNGDEFEVKGGFMWLLFYKTDDVGQVEAIIWKDCVIIRTTLDDEGNFTRKERCLYSTFENGDLYEQIKAIIDPYVEDKTTPTPKPTVEPTTNPGSSPVPTVEPTTSPGSSTAPTAEPTKAPRYNNIPITGFKKIYSYRSYIPGFNFCEWGVCEYTKDGYDKPETYLFMVTNENRNGYGTFLYTTKIISEDNEISFDVCDLVINDEDNKRWSVLEDFEMDPGNKLRVELNNNYEVTYAGFRVRENGALYEFDISDYESTGSLKNISEFNFKINATNSPVPTSVPTAEPTVKPTAEPTVKPTAEPTLMPTQTVTPEPNAQSTSEPTEETEVKESAEEENADLSFNDISGHWAEDTINAWKDKGIISGYPDGSFKPDNYVTRAELAKIMTLAFDLQETTTLEYTDIDSSEWYYLYLKYAGQYIPSYGLPIVYETDNPYQSSDGKFLPECEAIRMHVAEGLVKLKMEKENLSIELPPIIDINEDLRNTFKDGEYESLFMISPGQTEPPANVRRVHEYTWLSTELGIMEGYPDGYFGPNMKVTRAEILTMLDRIFV